MKRQNLKAFSSVNEAIEQTRNIENDLNQKNDDLQANIETLEIEKHTTEKNMKLRVKEISRLEIENKNLKEQSKTSFKDLESENNKLKEEVIEKDNELKKTMDEKANLQEKMESLLDLLYGCNQCGLCECECNDPDKEDCGSSVPPQHETTRDPSPDTTSQTPAPQSRSTPWTPPPSPPCSNCGGINFGPCPSSVCFGCIPPLSINSEPDASSPSRTPPGTPPLFRLEQRAGKARPRE